MSFFTETLGNILSFIVRTTCSLNKGSQIKSTDYFFVTYTTTISYENKFGKNPI